MIYVPIYCDTQRRRDMEPFGPRGGRPLFTPATGRSYAKWAYGEWFCTCCGKLVKVVM